MVKKSDYFKSGYMEWWAFPIEDLDNGLYSGFTRFGLEHEVDLFFPGDVYPVPAWIT